MPYFNESKLEMSIVTLLPNNDDLNNNQTWKSR